MHMGRTSRLRRCWACRATLAGTLVATLLGGLPAGSDAAPRPRRAAAVPAVPVMPFGDPETMFERMFGPPSDDDKIALAKIDVSVREERQMGQTALDAYRASLQSQNIAVIRSGADIDYLRRLVTTLQPLMTNRRRYPTIQVLVADSPKIDARSFPGGSIVVFRGLLDSAGSEAALVGILGHELAHLDRGHVLQRAKRMKLAQQTFSGGMRGMTMADFFNATATSLRMWTRPFQPEDEAEADSDGARMAYRAGYDPREMARLFLELKDQQGAQPSPVPTFLQSHPAPADRHKAIMDLYEELQSKEPKPGLYIGAENLKRRTPRSVRAFRE
jgi:predicted Zn-dependent protease